MSTFYFYFFSISFRTRAGHWPPQHYHCPLMHVGHLCLLAATPLVACHHTDLITRATHLPCCAQLPHPIATTTNTTITAIAPAIATSSKLIISPNPPTPCTPLTGRCYSFTYQRAPAANAHKTLPMVLHCTNPKKVSISTFKLTMH